MEMNASGEAPDTVPLLRALCLSCGFLAWFQVGVPENIQR
jgi:hypothetical protein